jgi:two-component system, cell cycle response regulator
MKPKPENRVLVVDDSPIYQHLIAAHMREWGFELVTATNGTQAWEILRRPGSPLLALVEGDARYGWSRTVP